MGDLKREPEPAAAGTGPRDRQPYQKPAVTWDEQLDARPGLVVACNKVTNQSTFCDSAAGS